MAITIRDPDLERRLSVVKRKRRHKTKSRTLRELAIERLTQLEERKTPALAAACGGHQT
jgi:hypothetical protein